ncbi:MAG TPA: DCC1-like thiol-disulfide oxidoreductase family protein [Hyphomicrobiaceae bacterium]|nr:DCC1-like thiol-disulfide oxidoreductase family protein [Hyphomicrobiaceae bacterium]
MTAPAGSIAQRLAGKAPYTYRSDPRVPPFADDTALLVFDGVCVLCSASARFILKRDHARHFRFATAQSPLGQALFDHYGLDAQTFETNLVLFEGRAYGKLDTVVVAGTLLGGVWRALTLLRVLPHALADWLYDRVARNRYRLFGRTQHCMMPPPEWRDRFI